MIIVDSVLPYDLIVAAQGPEDSSPIDFWYGDQWWTGNNQDHHCSFGAYDSGARQGDCGFTCALPIANPAPSATITMPLPAGATAAIGGSMVFTNTYITASPTPSTPGPPLPPPTPTYATGWCWVHVVQYQKWEAGENPTGNYEVEVTIFDAAKSAIGTSGQVPALTGQAVDVAGLVMPFQVTAPELDSQPLGFAYNGRSWNSDSSDCSTGGYDSGKRDMDCGFSC